MRPPRVRGCGCKVVSGQLCGCQRARKADADRQRPSSRQRGYTRDWERESKAFLARPENRLCACGCGGAAEVVDHRFAHKGNQRLFWNRANWQPMTRRCNSAKAAREEGGFGNRGRSQTLPGDAGTVRGAEFSAVRIDVSGIRR